MWGYLVSVENMNSQVGSEKMKQKECGWEQKKKEWQELEAKTSEGPQILKSEFVIYESVKESKEHHV